MQIHVRSFLEVGLEDFEGFRIWLEYFHATNLRESNESRNPLTDVSADIDDEIQVSPESGWQMFDARFDQLRAHRSGQRSADCSPLIESDSFESPPPFDGIVKARRNEVSDQCRSRNRAGYLSLFGFSLRVVIALMVIALIVIIVIARTDTDIIEHDAYQLRAHVKKHL